MSADSTTGSGLPGTVDEQPDPEEQVAWEQRSRSRAAVAALLGGLLPLAAGVAAGILYSDAPDFVPRQIVFIDDNAAALVVVAVVQALGAVAIALALTYLYTATRARTSSLPGVARIMAIAGPLLLALGSIVAQIATVGIADDFVREGRLGLGNAEDAFKDNGVLTAAVIARLAGSLAMGFAFVLICLNAMRVGLLTRFMGVLGIITGALQILPFAGPLPVVQCFWLLMLSLLFLGRWPNGTPPAWRTGNAEPWPSSAQIREQRQRERRGDADEPSEPEPVGAGPSPAARKRKRKRR